MNGAYLDPTTRTLTVHARMEDVTTVADDGDVVFTVENLVEGIEIPHDGPLWQLAWRRKRFHRPKARK